MKTSLFCVISSLKQVEFLCSYGFIIVENVLLLIKKNKRLRVNLHYLWQRLLAMNGLRTGSVLEEEKNTIVFYSSYCFPIRVFVLRLGLVVFSDLPISIEFFFFSHSLCVFPSKYIKNKRCTAPFFFVSPSTQ